MVNQGEPNSDQTQFDNGLNPTEAAKGWKYSKTERRNGRELKRILKHLELSQTMHRGPPNYDGKRRETETRKWLERKEKNSRGKKREERERPRVNFDGPLNRKQLEVGFLRGRKVRTGCRMHRNNILRLLQSAEGIPRRKSNLQSPKVFERSAFVSGLLPFGVSPRSESSQRL